MNSFTPYTRKYPNGIIETNKVKVSRDKEGRKIVNEFLFLENLGRGTFGKVKKCVDNKGNEYAVKIVNKALLRKKKKSYGKTKEGFLKINYMIDDALNEIEIFKSFPYMHENVLKLYYILNDDVMDKTYLIMELGEYGAIISLDRNTGVFHINNHYNDKIYDEALIKNWMIDIAKGIEFLHENGIVHRDIKSDNVVIGKNEKLKIIDFGTAYKLKDNKDEFNATIGNFFFYPPEFVTYEENKTFGYKPVDIWAFGVSIYTVIFKTLPFLPENREDCITLFKMISESKFDFSKNGIKISDGMKELLCKIFEKDPKKRITAKEIVNSKFLNNK